MTNTEAEPTIELRMEFSMEESDRVVMELKGFATPKEQQYHPHLPETKELSKEYT